MAVFNCIEHCFSIIRRLTGNEGEGDGLTCTDRAAPGDNWSASCPTRLADPIPKAGAQGQGIGQQHANRVPRPAIA